MNEGILKTEKLTHVYSPGTPFEMVAVRDVDIEIRKGEVLGIIGHTGSGKSTLIQHFNALVKPSSGRVLLEGRDINESKETIKDARAKVGLVFQYPEYQLFEETVYKDIAFGPKNMKLSESEIDERVRKAARFVGVEEELLDRSPFDLSGGQKRRVAIAGVIAMMPEVLVLDEPMAGLDPQGREEIMANILSYHEETGAATVAALSAGASVCHVDAAKGMVAWAKENAVSSNVADKSVRWIVDDCAKFVEREIRRGHKYDAIIMDPPSYGRGPGGEVWKLETNLMPFVSLCAGVLSDEPLFVLINSYTTGLSASTIGYVAQTAFAGRGGHAESRELGLPVTATGLNLPCGAACRMEF